MQDLNYTYDPSGNITETFDAAVPTEFFNGAVIEPRKRYVYDSLYRLIEATGREHAGQLNFGLMDNWNVSQRQGGVTAPSRLPLSARRRDAAALFFLPSPPYTNSLLYYGGS